jgi:hypothetical protein
MNGLERIPERKKLSQYLLGNARTLMIVFILFVVVVVMTTDIRMATISDIKDFGSEFFLVLAASYGMYICCADGGIKNGLETDLYKESLNCFDELKKKIEGSMLSRMNEFCLHFIEKELQDTPMHYLSVVCIPYDVYMEKYVKLSKDDIDALPDLTDTQKKAVKRANKVKPIKLTPEMIMTDGKTAHARSGLSLNPNTIKNIYFGIKMAKMSFTSICVSLIALEIIIEPSWTVFAEVCLKLVTVVLNGFDGHKEGFNNITVHTVNYKNAQTSLMRQAIQYIDAHPTTND